MGYWIAVVDDEPLSLTNAKNLLRSHGMRISCFRSGRDFMEFMGEHTPDLVLMDILMPEMDGFETYRALRQFEEDHGKTQTPVIFLTGESNNEAERRGLKAGASDFIHKPFDEDVLIKRINNTITNSKMIESLTEEATLDKLTGFLNKASGTERITALCREQSGTLMILDLDSFKLVNDLFGHDMGDRVLVAFAGVVRHNIRNADIVCRIGGDEFMGYFPGLEDEAAVASLSKRLNDELAKEAVNLMGEDHGIPLGVTIGAAYDRDNMDDYQILFRYADSALYEVKRNGKHGYSIYAQEKPKSVVDEDLDGEIYRILQIVSERGDGKGAVLLGQEAFAANYRFIVRYLSRYGGVCGRILFSLNSTEKDIIFNEIVSEFGNVLKATLRRTDIAIQWQHNRFFVVLPMLSQEDTDKVIERIMRAWSKTANPERVSISYATSQLKRDSFGGEPRE